MERPSVRTKERDVILTSLRAGVVPRLGLHHIQVGRNSEIAELVKDVDRIRGGGATIRFIIGEYGSGKTFFINLMRLVALEKGLVVMSADLAPDRRLHATGGQARSLYAEMTKNISTRTRPDGGALPSIVERFISQSIKEANDGDVASVIMRKLRHFEEMVGGYDFAAVIAKYWEGHDSGDDQLKSAALRWLRAEFTTKTDAKAALGVRTIIDDASVYDQIKLLSAFVTEAGYGGLLICLDEMVNLYKLTNSKTRATNYEQILRILNDVLQGSAAHVGFLFGGTPDFLYDTRRGLYSYEALQSRLAQNRFSRDGLVDLSGPVIQLQSLTPEDLFVLLANIRRVFSAGDDASPSLPDSALTAFMQHCAQHIGDAYFRTPRNTVTAFIHLLSILEQYPESGWEDHLGKVTIEKASGEDLTDISDGDEEDELASFKL